MKRVVNVLIVVLLVFVSFNIVQKHNLNGFKLAHYYVGKTDVTRDSKVKYNSKWSYKIESKDFNDYMIYQKIKVQKNTAYKISCMVKTQDVEAEEKNCSGFCIGLKDGLEKSPSLFGTNNWTQLEFYFDSKNNNTVDVAFRLGDNNQNCKGTVWFSDIKLEVGRKKQTSNWNIAVFMINNTNVDINGERISEKISNTQFTAIKNALSSFKETIQNFTNGKMQVSYDIINIDKPLTSISYDNETGYYISTKDSYELINSYLYKEQQYDHIFIVANIGDEIKTDNIDWIGLGGMLYDCIGYSNIRISDECIESYINSSSNYFPEEIIVHEFLHTLERNSINLGYETIKLHDFEEYGYKNEVKYGQKNWYRDYLQNKINDTNNGIREEIYYTQPVSKWNFIKRDDITEILYDNQNIIQKINEKISNIL